MSLTIPVAGMSCAACATRVERALSRLAPARVNLLDETATLDGSPPLPDIAAALSRAGYALRLEDREWPVEGMSCATCTARVERALLRSPGVLEARANLATNTVAIRTLAGTDPGLLEAALSRAGYRHAPEPDAAPRPFGQPEAELLAASLLAAPFLWGMLGMALGRDWMPGPVWQLALAMPLQFVFGWRFYRGAWAALRAGTGNMDLLVALGTSAAFLLSLWRLTEAHAHHLYFEASALVILFVLLGKWLEGRAKQATGAAIRALLALRPRTALRLDAGNAEEEIPAALLRPGDRVAIRPGGRVPADGTVEAGEAGADESALSGESRAVHKGPGAALAAGTTVLDGRLVMRVTATGAETALARVAALVAAAQSTRAPVQRLVDRVSAIFVPAVVALAILTLLGWLAAGAAWQDALLPAVAVLVVACPCALGLATPAAIMAGTGAAARAGILLRDAEAIQRGARLDLVAFDKTGTLTEGQPRLAAIHTEEAQAIRWAAALQAGSEHPLARATLAAAPGAPLPATGFRALPGRGVRGEVGGRSLLLGSARLLAESGFPDPFGAEAAGEAAQGRTLSWLIEEGRGVLALLAFEDAPRAGAAEAVAALRARGLRVVMLSGDGHAAASALAARLGITELAAPLLPEDKLARLRAWQGEGLRVAMVGDGINDAPALAQADLGLAMGTGTEVAIAAAPITMLRPDPRLVPAALDVAHRTLWRIRGNLMFAFGYNAAALPLAALGMLNPAIAGSVMAMSSVSVLANAMWLARWRPGEEARR